MSPLLRINLSQLYTIFDIQALRKLLGDFQDKILCGAILVCNRYSEQSICNTRIYNLISIPQITRFCGSSSKLKKQYAQRKNHYFRVKQTRVVAARSRREVMAMLEIMKQYHRSFHLFQLFTENNKPIFFGASPV